MLDRLHIYIKKNLFTTKKNQNSRKNLSNWMLSSGKAANIPSTLIMEYNVGLA